MLSSGECSILVKDFITLQEERTRQFSKLNLAHKTYLNTAPSYDLDTFKLTVHQVTVSFQSISNRIIEIKDSIKESKLSPELVEFLEKIQYLEEKKLKNTVAYQLALEKANNQPDDEQMEHDAKEIKTNIDEISNEINESLQEIRSILYYDLSDQPER